MIRKMQIEAALQWAFKNELPKAAISTRDLALRQGPAQAGRGWDAMSNFAELLAVVDTNRFGVTPDLTSWTDPHPDAVIIGEAVERLDELVISVPDDWQPLADLDLAPDVARLVQEQVSRISTSIADSRRVFGIATRELVRRHAVMSDAPDWILDDPPALQFERHGNSQPRWFIKRIRWEKDPFGNDVGHEFEADGMNHAAKRPYGDAYRRPFLDPDPHFAIVARAEYECWHSALSHLTAELEHQLTSIELIPFTRSPRPWICPEAAPSILPDLSDLAPPQPRASAGRPAPMPATFPKVSTRATRA